MITSKRTFGVEMECSANGDGNVNRLSKIIGREWRFDDDGSIRHVVPNPTEVVSPVLAGKRGADELRKVCLAMKDLGFNADHIACGMHVHLGADEFKQKDDLIVLSESEFDSFAKNTKNVKSIVSIAYLNTSTVKAWFGLTGSKLPLTKRYRDFGGEMLGGRWGSGCFSETDKDSFYTVDEDCLIGESQVRVRHIRHIDKKESKRIRAER